MDNSYYNILQDKIITENRSYRLNLIQTSPSNILLSSYQTCIFNEIEELSNTLSEHISEEDAENLNIMPNLLEKIFDEIIANECETKAECNIQTHISNIIVKFAKILKRCKHCPNCKHYENERLCNLKARCCIDIENCSLYQNKEN